MYSWTDSEIRWETYPFAEVPNANAIRFGTVYNFRFDVQAPPTCEGAAAIHLFRSPNRDPYVVQVIGRQSAIPVSSRGRPTFPVRRNWFKPLCCRAM